MVEAKQNSKKRQRVALKSRLYNKARKSACATRLKKVSFYSIVLSFICLSVFYRMPRAITKVGLSRLVVATQVLTALGGFEKVQSEEELQPVQPLINAAYEELDKAVQKGILHANTVARRKSRIAVTRQKILILSGLYTPASS